VPIVDPISDASLEKQIMETVNIRVIHPTDHSEIEIGLPENILVRDVFSQLVDANFLASGRPYSGVLKPNGTRTESVTLENDKTIRENGVSNNDTIQMITTTQAGQRRLPGGSI
jgi:ribosomal protein L3